MKKRKKIWLAGVLATLTIIGTAPASLATETETVTVAQEETEIGRASCRERV